ncbi:response regulator [Methylophaga lonarensis MPL]|uniref:diguanylate cyclase n=1 Tax=Methylophaga lonarensis MPL TaxID=1286106 RepID=M7PPW1_9GAMM|nr:diguanylate cyclase [Methylophaga lonarensis]EMR12504.1 response regulator [Methylophaga lonarensis MPL]
MSRRSDTENLSPHHGVVTQSAFIELLASHWQNAQKAQYSLSLFVIDIDHFNNLTDKASISHQVFETLGQLFHRKTDALTRFGRNKILLMTTELSFKEAGLMAQRIHQAIQALALTSPQTPSGQVTVSIGHTTYTPAQEDDFGVLDQLSETLKHQQAASDQGGNTSHTRLYSQILK